MGRAVSINFLDAPFAGEAARVGAFPLKLGTTRQRRRDSD
jgi:hypothetical protein